MQKIWNTTTNLGFGTCVTKSREMACILVCKYHNRLWERAKKLARIGYNNANTFVRKYFQLEVLV